MKSVEELKAVTASKTQSTFEKLTERNKTPLHVAAENGQRDNVALLIEQGANINANSTFLGTPLHVAIKHGNRDIIVLLIDKGANILAKDSYHITPLMALLAKGYDNIVHNLLKKIDTHNPNFLNGILHTFIYCDKIKFVELLIENNPNINLNDEYEGNTSLGMAAWRGYKDIAVLLINKGADLNLKNENDMSPLDLAIKNGNISIVQFLLNEGFNIKALSPSKFKGLHIAIKNNDKEMAALLLEKGADVNAYCDGLTPLHIAVKEINLDLIELLLKKGANMFAKDSRNHTPLELISTEESQNIEYFGSDDKRLHLCNPEHPNERTTLFESIKLLFNEAMEADNFYGFKDPKLAKFDPLAIKKGSVFLERVRTQCVKRGLPQAYEELTQYWGPFILFVISNEQRNIIKSFFEEIETKEEFIAQKIEPFLAIIAYNEHPDKFPSPIPYSKLVEYSKTESPMNKQTKETIICLESYNDPNFDYLQPKKFVKNYLFNPKRERQVISLFCDNIQEADKILRELENVIIPKSSFTALENIRKVFYSTHDIIRKKLSNVNDIVTVQRIEIEELKLQNEELKKENKSLLQRLVSQEPSAKLAQYDLSREPKSFADNIREEIQNNKDKKKINSIYFT